LFSPQGAPMPMTLCTLSKFFCVIEGGSPYSYCVFFWRFTLSWFPSFFSFLVFLSLLPSLRPIFSLPRSIATMAFGLGLGFLLEAFPFPLRVFRFFDTRVLSLGGPAPNHAGFFPFSFFFLQPSPPPPPFCFSPSFFFSCCPTLPFI